MVNLDSHTIAYPLCRADYIGQLLLITENITIFQLELSANNPYLNVYYKQIFYCFEEKSIVIWEFQQIFITIILR